MRKIDWDKVPVPPWMALMTSDEISPDSPIQMADFRDVSALYYEQTGKFIGLTRDGHLKFGKKPLRMVDGIWFLEEDADIKLTDVPASKLVLNVIK